MQPRHFYRCTECLEVMAIGERLTMEYSRTIATCGICGASMEYMGRVERDRLVTDETRCACDDRCTSARGPICVCSCGGKNHGAGLAATVQYTVDRGKAPTLQPPTTISREKALARVREYLAAITALRDAFMPLADRKAAGQYLPAADFYRLRDMQQVYREAIAARVHAVRMRKLAPWRPAPAAAATPARTDPITPTTARRQAALSF